MQEQGSTEKVLGQLSMKVTLWGCDRGDTPATDSSSYSGDDAALADLILPLYDLPSRSCDFLPGSLDALEIVDIVGLLELLRRAEFCITHLGLPSPSLTTITITLN